MKLAEVHDGELFSYQGKEYKRIKLLNNKKHRPYANSPIVVLCKDNKGRDLPFSENTEVQQA